MIDPVLVTRAAQIAWLVLCGMMLFSRFVFQAAGAAWMRRFLNQWKVSTTHRVWGSLSLIVSAGLFLAFAPGWAMASWTDRALVGSAVVVLSADGLLNLVPAWFGHFKEKMQDAWVRRQRTAETADDRHLFGMVNALLGAASIVVAMLVLSVRPMASVVVAGAALAAALIMCSLVFLSLRERTESATQ